jgi:hypothetical protein
VTLVASAIRGSPSRFVDKNGVVIEDYEGGRAWQDVYKKVKIVEVMGIYETIVHESKGFDFLLDRKDGTFGPL